MLTPIAENLSLSLDTLIEMVFSNIISNQTNDELQSNVSFFLVDGVDGIFGLKKSEYWKR